MSIDESLGSSHKLIQGVVILSTGDKLEWLSSHPMQIISNKDQVGADVSNQVMFILDSEVPSPYCLHLLCVCVSTSFQFMASEGIHCSWNWTVLALPGERSGKLINKLESYLPIAYGTIS